jgi:YidC/Oxa1 family membrane protein insertase
MERRVLVAIFLSFIILYAYQAFVVKPTPKPAPGTSTTQGAARPAAPASSATNAPSAPSAPPAPVAAAAPALVGDSVEREIRIETRDVIAVLTNRGARLKSWRLKKYLDQQGHPQELIENQIPSQPLPFTLSSPDTQLDATLNNSLYSVSSAPPAAPIAAPLDLTFEYRDAAGARAVKTFHFAPDSYVIGVDIDVASGSRAIMPAIVWGPAVGDIAEISRYTQRAEGIVFQNGKVQRLSAKDIGKQPVYEGDFFFAGADDNYFMTVALSTGPSRVTLQPVTIPPPPGSKDAARELISFSVEPKRSGRMQFFAGPKDFDVLAAIGPDATRAINFGTFAVIVVPLLRSLKWVHSYVPNYGWAIIILTVIINILILPFRHMSVVSMRKMQAIQPEVKAIQDRYAKYKTTDPAKQKMNQEMMALYKERGVNPAGGCIPILLTFPLIFAFYALLSTAIELRGAPFMGWIHDLSAHDPYYVTPILMGASQLWQQWTMPAAGVDPAQQKMMMFMPVMFTFMFLWAPAGLAIYWLVSNLWQIGQQYVTNSIIGPPAVRTVRPAAERRLKRVGGGKTEAADPQKG